MASVNQWRLSLRQLFALLVACALAAWGWRWWPQLTLFVLVVIATAESTTWLFARCRRLWSRLVLGPIVVLCWLALYAGALGPIDLVLSCIYRDRREMPEIQIDLIQAAYWPILSQFPFDPTTPPGAVESTLRWYMWYMSGWLVPGWQFMAGR